VSEKSIGNLDEKATHLQCVTSYTKGLATSKIDRHPELKQFLLVDPKMGELAHRNNVYMFDVLNPKIRHWWADTVAKGVAESDCDGAFIDQMLLV
jgi:hypothetical protein